MATLPLSDVIAVNVSVGPVGSVRSRFNMALIVGDSKVIKLKDRVRTYSNLSDMSSDGWKGEEPEYIAAQIYFSQSPRPTKVAIGVWNKEGDVDNPKESAVEAMTACRESNSEWYLGYVCGATNEEIIKLSKYIEGATPPSMYAYVTDDEDVKDSIVDNLAETLSKSNASRTIGQYSTDEHAIMAIVGFAMGSNTQTASSAFTVKFKKEVGIKTEQLSASEVGMIKANNCNVYVNRGVNFDLFEDGVVANGLPFDEIMNLDIIKNNIQSAIINAFQVTPKIPQTKAGMDALLNSITPELEKARKAEIIAAGTWNLPGVLSVNTGDMLPRGYEVLADDIHEQSQADREDRKAPQIYVLLKLAGAIESAVINVHINR